MRLLHIDEQRRWRGGEQQASWLIQGLAARGHDNFLAGRPSGAFLQSEHGGVAVSRLGLPFLGEWDLYSASLLARLVREERIDILHAHTSHAHTLALLAKRLAGRSAVVVSRRIDFLPKSNPLNRWKYHAADRMVCVSHQVGRVMSSFGLSGDAVRVVHSSVDVKRLEVEPMPREEIGVPASGPLLFSAGALVGHKDHLNLLSAFARVRGQFSDAFLMIAGEGPLRAELEASVVQQGLESAVKFLGHRTDVPRLMRAADLYVSSSWSEGLGTSILEALACGTPVVAARAGGADEMVLPGKTGYLTPCRDASALAEAMIASLSDRDGARVMAEAGKALVAEEFTAQRMVERTEEVYRELLEGGVC